MDYIMRVLSAVLGLGLFFFIINGALKNARYKIRGFVNLILGLLLAGTFALAFFLDYEGGRIISYYRYFLFAFMSFVYGVSYAYHFLVHLRGGSLKKRNVGKYYFTDYLYIIYRHENDICLKKRKDKYQGLKYRLKRSEFHDSFIHNLNQKYKITGKVEINRLGKVTFRKERRTYFCYEINVLEAQEIEKLASVNAYQLINLEMDDLDREILYRMILRDQFDLDK